MNKDIIYVGHRGTKLGIGVENTKEAYLEAAKLGYDAIETDVRVTLDGVYIAFHDETTTRLTKNSKKQYDIYINSSHYKDIKDIQLTQISNNVKRVGKICLIDEYLDICKEYNCIPIIELKWTNGIYSHNDNKDNHNYSNIDGLIKKLYERNLEDKAYIMTSMIGCLEYVKENYPNIRLQWLCHSRTKEFMEYCTSKGMNLDVEYSYLDEEVVTCAKKHNKLVNIWTLNDEALLDKFINMGIDMVTTDLIKPRGQND